jgi:NAD(P)-dependent dehydrogenase (short-subunit alcohol dehydrogenase family)
MSIRTALVSSTDPATTQALTGRLTTAGLRPVIADPADPARAVAGLDALDALICCVASPAPRAFLDTDPAGWYADVLASLIAPFRLIRAAVPLLRASGDGRVVLIGGGWQPGDRPGDTAAAAVHGAVVALTKTLARDLGPAGITVNEVVTDPSAPAVPEVVAGAAAYLCGPAAGAVVGQLLTVGRGGPLRP